MIQVPAVDLSDIIVSIARSVVEANKVLSEGTDTPMGITEFRVKYQIHASLSVPVGRQRDREAFAARTLYELAEPMRLRDYTTFSLREKILTAHKQSAELEISSLIQPLPKVAVT
jgi:hypothetical protein